MSVAFWLGAHHPEWLTRAGVPLMVSYRALQHRQSLPRAGAPWTQDSSGFTELQLHTRYQTLAREYAARTRVHMAEIGSMRWAAVQDWMCEPDMLKRTGLSIADHQRRTIESLLDLRELAPEVPWLPVLQGYELDDYRRHADAYAAAGVELTREPVVGLGTVCRRQDTVIAARIIHALARLGIRLHGFGLKITGLLRAKEWLASADSMAWSLDGRLTNGGRCHRIRDHRSCANCLDHALAWRERLVARLSQLSLSLEAA